MSGRKGNKRDNKQRSQAEIRPRGFSSISFWNEINILWFKPENHFLLIIYCFSLNLQCVGDNYWNYSFLFVLYPHSNFKFPFMWMLINENKWEILYLVFRKLFCCRGWSNTEIIIRIIITIILSGRYIVLQGVNMWYEWFSSPFGNRAESACWRLPVCKCCRGWSGLVTFSTASEVSGLQPITEPAFRIS